jgi:flagellar basal-body rod protein FlgC
MDYSQSFAISAAGMNLERTRVDVAALNLANANTIQSVEGAHYRPLRVVARAAAMAVSGRVPFTDLFNQGIENSVADMSPLQSSIVSLEPTDSPPRLVYEPGHPMANEKGFVAYAGVDTATEMVTLMSATRSYEANVAAMNTARALALKTLEIGGV